MSVQEDLLQKIRNLQPPSNDGVHPIPVPWTYNLGVVGVGGMLCLMSLLYILFCMGMVYAVLYHAVYDIDLLKAFDSPLGTCLAYALYLLPLLLGTAFTVGLWKPLFAPSLDRSQRYFLDRTQEPLLFTFIDKLAEMAGAPRPAYISIDMNPNAGVSFLGTFGMLKGEMVLTLGLPLIDAMDIRLMAAAIAHELGHFTQTTGLKLSYFIHGIYSWFLQSVYERDRWDLFLSRWANSNQWYFFPWLAVLMQFSVWIARKTLWLFSFGVVFLHGLLQRQKEFDADQFAIAIAGSESVGMLMMRISELETAFQSALAKVESYYREGRLIDDFSQLVVHETDALPEHSRSALALLMSMEKTGWFDSHPAAKERIASAMRQNVEGVLRWEIPAGLLLMQKTKIARETTAEFYRDLLGNEFDPKYLQTTAAGIERFEEEKAHHKAIRRVFRLDLKSFRPLALSKKATPYKNIAEVAETLTSLHEELTAAAPSYEKHLRSFNEVESAWKGSQIVLMLFEMGATEYKHFHKLSEVIDWIQALTSRRKIVERDLEPYEKLAATWLETAFSVVRSPALQGFSSPLVKRLVAIQPLYSFLAFTDQVHPTIRAMHETGAVLMGLLPILDEIDEGDGPPVTVRIAMRKLTERIGDFRKACHAVRYPFDHSQHGISVAEYLLKTLPSEQDIGALLFALGEVQTQWTALLQRAVGTIATMVEEIERELGIAPLPDKGVAEPTVE